jgi:demethylmenaquinone methyltransferase / 2-methoxy-6-polyprenyl-1,4-benzoquinol methylase
LARASEATGIDHDLSAPGTRPVGAHDELEAERQVREMFSRIAPRYDFLNHFLSASFDKMWRRRAAESFAHILTLPNAQVLDVCCGTGDLIFALERAASRSSKKRVSVSGGFTGADFALPMLGLARAKGLRGEMGTRFLAGDALKLPLRSGSMDLVTSAFGFRNLSNYRRGLTEFARILRQGGELGILEFCEPQNGVLAALYRVYFKQVLPRIGGAISGSSDAYTYLPSSVRKFPQPEILKRWIEDAGFGNVNFERWTCGIVTLHRGVRE